MTEIASILNFNSPYADIDASLYKDFLNNRILVINEEISENVVENYILFIIKWNAEDRNIPVECRTPITIIINSPGGSMFDGWGLVSVILQSKTPVNAVGLGLVASMGYYIYLSCDNRYAFKDTVFLQHDGEIELSSVQSRAKQTMGFMETMEKRSKEFVLERTTMSEDFYDSVYDSEYWFYSEKGKELGVVHNIFGEDVELSDIL